MKAFHWFNSSTTSAFVISTCLNPFGHKTDRNENPFVRHDSDPFRRLKNDGYLNDADHYTENGENYSQSTVTLAAKSREIQPSWCFSPVWGIRH